VYGDPSLGTVHRADLLEGEMTVTPGGGEGVGARSCFGLVSGQRIIGSIRA